MGAQPCTAPGQAGLSFPPCGGTALALPVGAALPSHCIPTPRPALPGKQPLLPLSHPSGSLILPPGAGFPEQGHCESHWSPAANKTHRCGERAHKTGHPPPKGAGSVPPPPHSGLGPGPASSVVSVWPPQLSPACAGCGRATATLACVPWCTRARSAGSQDSCSSWDTPAPPLTDPTGGSFSPPTWRPTLA